MNKQPISRQFFLMYALAFVGVWMDFIAPTMSGLQIRIGQIDSAYKASGLALVLAIGNQSVNYMSLYLGAAIIAVIGAGVIMTIKKLR